MCRDHHIASVSRSDVTVSGPAPGRHGHCRTVILAVAADQAAAADTEPAVADPTEVDRALASKSS